MNSVLELRGRFDHQGNQGGSGPKNLPVRTYVKSDKILKLKKELEEILAFWQQESWLGGALVSVHYIDVVAKSNRIGALLAPKGHHPNDFIRGAKFEGTEKPRHVFTHFISLNTIETSIKLLGIVAGIVSSDFNGVISHNDISLFNQKLKPYIYDSIISRTKFTQVLIDSYFVERFDVDKCEYEDIEGESIVTLYGTGNKTTELMRKLGIDVISAGAQLLNENTIRLMPEELQQLCVKAPYLIAMQVKDLAEIPTLNFDKETEDTEGVYIPQPSNEPIVGVIDTPFCKDVYFGEWVDYRPEIDANIEPQPADFKHGTAISSIIVDGPSFNKDLEDDCGRFRVRHFGVATAGRFSSFTILKKIREIVSKNTDIKVWNLSLGSTMEIHANFMSPEAAELDRIQSDYDVVFVVAGTNRPDGFDKQGMKIGAPADSLNSLVVNAVDAEGNATTYHRVGPVLSFFHKPDVSYYGGERSNPIRVCTPTGEGYLSGTSIAAPWITRKMAYLIYNMRLSREVAKAMLIDSAAGWNRRDDRTYSIGYGVVPKSIKNIINSADDEIRFVMTGSTDDYETFTYKIPVPLSNDKHPFFARATLCYFPNSSREQGVDYTNTEMDIHFGRVDEKKNGKVGVFSINNNHQGDDGYKVYEGTARELYRKWDNIKHISEKVKKGAHPKTKKGNGDWGLSIKTKERLKSKRDHSMPFGVVITLKEMSGVNRFDDFVKLCMVRGWIVNKIDIDNRFDVYNKAEEEVTFE